MKHVTLTALMIATALSACATGSPENRESVAQGTAYQAQYRGDRDARMAARNARSIELNARKCAGPVTAASAVQSAERELLSRGDLLDVKVGDDETFSGRFEVSRDGQLKLPHMNAVPAHGRETGAIEDEIARRLVGEGYYRSAPRVSIRIADFAPARVHVTGAVFEPGSTDIGAVAGADRDGARQEALGASTEGRSLARALQASGGVRPDADLSRVTIVRGGERIVVDARPAVEGRRFADIMLLADDEVEVPSRGCFQEALMVPSAVTAAGVKVFMSNLTKPADANALSAIGKDARELRYGTRFVQAVVGMNCVGGTRSTNADRSAVLFSRNPITGESIVIERKIEDLLQRADRDDLDPYILPGDAIACYDSTVTNIVEVAKSFTSVLTAPLPLLAL